MENTTHVIPTQLTDSFLVPRFKVKKRTSQHNAVHPSNLSLSLALLTYLSSSKTSNFAELGVPSNVNSQSEPNHHLILT